jgi:hypothetical protein
MNDPTFPARRRRALVLGVAILLLHWLALRWLGGQVGAPRQRVPGGEHDMLFAQVLAPVPRPAPPPPRPLLVREPEPELVVPPPPPLPAADAGPNPAALAQGPQLSDPGAGTNAPAAAPQSGAAPASQVVQSTQAEAAVPAAPPAPAAPPSYRVDMPPSANLVLDVARTDADGTRWSGEQTLAWKIDGNRYRIEAEAGIRVVFTRVNLLVLTSEGLVTDSGFTPLTMTEKRRGRSMTATHFNRDKGTITFSASQSTYPLAAGAQDKASVPLQLAAIARADPQQLARGVDILVGEDRDATVFHFVLVGQEQIETRLGRLMTWHLSRPPKPGSYNSRLDIWLAPERGWYPVQIRNLEASGAVTTQTVNNIAMNDTGS